MPKLLLILGLASLTAHAQTIKTLCQGKSEDSSYYHIAQISSNEYWVGGEYGILHRVDSLGNDTPINYPNTGASILKIVRVGDYVFLTTQNAVIYRYDRVHKTWKTKQFETFANLAFYGLWPLQNGKLLVCGGSSVVAAGGKAMPRGFIAEVDTGLAEIKTLYSRKTQFVWTAVQLENSDVIAACYNGRITKIKRSILGGKWQTWYRKKALVHELYSSNGSLKYCGARSFRIGKNGVEGKLESKRGKYMNPTSGCIWSIADWHYGGLLGCTQNGWLVQMHMNCKCNLEQKQPIQMPTAYPMYDMQWISSNRLLIVGHGRGMYLLQP